MEFLAGRTQPAADFRIDVGDLGSFDVSSVTANTSGRSGVELLAVAEQLKAEAVRRLVPFDDADLSVLSGYATPARHLAVETGMSNREAQAVASVIRLVARYQLTSKALSSGLITVAEAANRRGWTVARDPVTNRIRAWTP